MSKESIAQIKPGGRLTLPRGVVASLGLKPGGIVIFKELEGGGVQLKKSPAKLRLIGKKEKTSGDH